MITSLREDKVDICIGLTEGWVAGLLNDQGQKLKGYNIVGSWVETPLRWAVVTGRNREAINSIDDLKRHKKVGVSRLGSGSHVMAFVLADQEGWLNSGKNEQSQALDFVPLGPFAQLRDGVTGNGTEAPTADFFMWEHFTTKPYFDGEDTPLKKIGEIYTPWPSWHIAASTKTFPHPKTDDRLQQLFAALDKGIKEFEANPDRAVKILGTGEAGCHYTEDDAREWLKDVKFSHGVRGVSEKTMDNVVRVLQSAGVIAPSVEVKTGDGHTPKGTIGYVSGEDEERPKHTSEIGTLKKLPNKGTAWLGSSSGVYFANTVRQAFSAAFATSHGLPPNEDILTGEDAEGRSYNGPTLTGPSATDPLPQLILPALGKLPDQKLGLELVTAFFQAWHPILPFLHGPSFLKDMEGLFQSQSAVAPASLGLKDRQGADGQQADSSDAVPLDVRKQVAFQLIINIAALDRPDIQLPAASRINSTADVRRIAGALALDHSLTTIQTLLAAQLYLCATLAIRAASTVGGIIVKLIFHAGLHRCPLRYAHLSPEDCEIRKRIFWSAYALDRHCALSLGDPNTIQDNDIDVCLSGTELHKAAVRDYLPRPDPETGLHIPASQQSVGGLDQAPIDHDPNDADEETGVQKEKKLLREAALISFVQWARLIGRIIDIFHKSVNHRYPNQDTIVFLTSDIETWWNDLPSFFSEPESAQGEIHGHLSRFAPFFKILYHRLHLLMSRPRLSLDQSTPQFQHGLSICIRASRNIVSGLKEHQRQAPKPETSSPTTETVRHSTRDNSTRPAKRRQSRSAHEIATELDREITSPKTGTDTPSSNLSSPNFTLPVSIPEAAAKDTQQTSPFAWSHNLPNKPNDAHFSMTGLASSASPYIRASTGGSRPNANPPTTAESQLNIGIPELPYNAGMGNVMDDPVFWDNLDFNQLDIFGSAMWETMTGPYAPGWETGGGLGGSGGGWVHNGTTAV
ncbi:hypothetical protein DV738_g3168, partial [Chaetothyriales sp. CBS 135597]